MVIMQLESNISKAIYVSCLTIFLTGLASWAVLAHQNAPSGMPEQPKADMSDARFARGAATGGMAEIQLGRLAGERGSSDVVKAFAERMVVQHGAAADQLQAVAQKENVTLPARLTSHEQQTYDQMARLRGGAFDRAYAQHMVEAHEKDLNDFQSEANLGNDQNMRAFADQSLSMIQEHLNQAREMLKAVSQTSSHATSSHSSGK
jgi:putative membrane protein